MAETKYGKYFIEYDPSRYPNERRPVMARMESGGQAAELTDKVRKDIANNKLL